MAPHSNPNSTRKKRSRSASPNRVAKRNERRRNSTSSGNVENLVNQEEITPALPLPVEAQANINVAPVDTVNEAASSSSQPRPAENLNSRSRRQLRKQRRHQRRKLEKERAQDIAEAVEDQATPSVWDAVDTAEGQMELADFSEHEEMQLDEDDEQVPDLVPVEDEPAVWEAFFTTGAQDGAMEVDEDGDVIPDLIPVDDMEVEQAQASESQPSTENTDNQQNWRSHPVVHIPSATEPEVAGRCTVPRNPVCLIELPVPVHPAVQVQEPEAAKPEVVGRCTLPRPPVCLIELPVAIAGTSSFERSRAIRQSRIRRIRGRSRSSSSSRGRRPVEDGTVRDAPVEDEHLDEAIENVSVENETVDNEQVEDEANDSDVVMEDAPELVETTQPADQDDWYLHRQVISSNPQLSASTATTVAPGQPAESLLTQQLAAQRREHELLDKWSRREAEEHAAMERGRQAALEQDRFETEFRERILRDLPELALDPESTASDSESEEDAPFISAFMALNTMFTNLKNGNLVTEEDKIAFNEYCRKLDLDTWVKVIGSEWPAVVQRRFFLPLPANCKPEELSPLFFREERDAILRVWHQFERDSVLIKEAQEKFPTQGSTSPTSWDAQVGFNDRFEDEDEVVKKILDIVKRKVQVLAFDSLVRVLGANNAAIDPIADRWLPTLDDELALQNWIRPLSFAHLTKLFEDFLKELDATETLLESWRDGRFIDILAGKASFKDTTYEDAEEFEKRYLHICRIFPKFVDTLSTDDSVRLRGRKVIKTLVDRLFIAKKLCSRHGDDFLIKTRLGTPFRNSIDTGAIALWEDSARERRNWQELSPLSGEDSSLKLYLTCLHELIDARSEVTEEYFAPLEEFFTKLGIWSLVKPVVDTILGKRPFDEDIIEFWALVRASEESKQNDIDVPAYLQGLLKEVELVFEAITGRLFSFYRVQNLKKFKEKLRKTDLVRGSNIKRSQLSNLWEYFAYHVKDDSARLGEKELKDLKLLTEMVAGIYEESGTLLQRADALASEDEVAAHAAQLVEELQEPARIVDMDDPRVREQVLLAHLGYRIWAKSYFCPTPSGLAQTFYDEKAYLTDIIAEFCRLSHKRVHHLSCDDCLKLQALIETLVTPPPKEQLTHESVFTWLQPVLDASFREQITVLRPHLSVVDHNGATRFGRNTRSTMSLRKSFLRPVTNIITGAWSAACDNSPEQEAEFMRMFRTITNFHFPTQPLRIPEEEFASWILRHGFAKRLEAILAINRQMGTDTVRKIRIVYELRKAEEEINACLRDADRQMDTPARKLYWFRKALEEREVTYVEYPFRYVRRALETPTKLAVDEALQELKNWKRMAVMPIGLSHAPRVEYSELAEVSARVIGLIEDWIRERQRILNLQHLKDQSEVARLAINAVTPSSSNVPAVPENHRLLSQDLLDQLTALKDKLTTRPPVRPSSADLQPLCEYLVVLQTELKPAGLESILEKAVPLFEHVSNDKVCNGFTPGCQLNDPEANLTAHSNVEQLCESIFDMVRYAHRTENTRNDIPELLATSDGKVYGFVAAKLVEEIFVELAQWLIFYDGVDQALEQINAEIEEKEALGTQLNELRELQALQQRIELLRSPGSGPSIPTIGSRKRSLEELQAEDQAEGVAQEQENDEKRVKGEQSDSFEEEDSAAHVSLDALTELEDTRLIPLLADFDLTIPNLSGPTDETIFKVVTPQDLVYLPNAQDWTPIVPAAPATNVPREALYGHKLYIRRGLNVRLTYALKEWVSLINDTVRGHATKFEELDGHNSRTDYLNICFPKPEKREDYSDLNPTSVDVKKLQHHLHGIWAELDTLDHQALLNDPREFVEIYFGPLGYYLNRRFWNDDDRTERISAALIDPVLACIGGEPELNTKEKLFQVMGCLEYIRRAVYALVEADERRKPFVRICCECANPCTGREDENQLDCLANQCLLLLKDLLELRLSELYREQTQDLDDMDLDENLPATPTNSAASEGHPTPQITATQDASHVEPSPLVLSSAEAPAQEAAPVLENAGEVDMEMFEAAMAEYLALHYSDELADEATTTANVSTSEQGEALDLAAAIPDEEMQDVAAAWGLGIHIDESISEAEQSIEMMEMDDIISDAESIRSEDFDAEWTDIEDEDMEDGETESIRADPIDEEDWFMLWRDERDVEPEAESVRADDIQEDWVMVEAEDSEEVNGEPEVEPIRADAIEDEDSDMLEAEETDDEDYEMVDDFENGFLSFIAEPSSIVFFASTVVLLASVGQVILGMPQ
ncbi:hypothetical protein BJ508DRAFT_364015 [Ascobolus immersus RN42]|uniref:Uncharacterized protein n=1 Tax=Ascobolus immersus RN42 TaxID=1160509 RepID=A0A3N4I096_ASCIM|nr:hypothetical protein BJ508DRAFT_364015 [Ascobolus immersus RN42]